MNINQDQTQLMAWEVMLFRAANAISLSEAQYSLIETRYSELQRILDLAEDHLLKGAHIFVQGSIGLKTTLKPSPMAENEMATIDADAVIVLNGASDAAALDVLNALQAHFEKHTKVKSPIVELRRGIRIVYADENPGFHVDITPARLIGTTSDNHNPYHLEVPDRVIRGWKSSSPKPYSQWLQSVSEKQINVSDVKILMEQHNIRFAEASQEPLPEYGEYIDGNPLRATIKLLKRHRDEWAIRNGKQSERPISAIITTLAGLAYEEIAMQSTTKPLKSIEAIIQIVKRMQKFVVGDAVGKYQIANPKDNKENFAEKWNRPGEGSRYRDAFYEWHEKAVFDIQLGFHNFGTISNFANEMKERFGVTKELVEEEIRRLPKNWTIPGQAPGFSQNAASLAAFSGMAAASSSSQASTRPVERLG